MSRLTTADASFVYTESMSGPMHISSVMVLEGELAYERVFEHIQERLHLIPAYRRKLVSVPMNIAHPRWTDDPDFDLANHVLHRRVPEGSSLEVGFDEAIRLNEEMLDRSKPLWKFVVISGVPNQTLILQATHHAMIDGASGVELISIIYDLDPEGTPVHAPNEPWQPEPEPSAGELFSEAMRDNFDKLAKTDLSRLSGWSDQQQALMARAARVVANFVARPVVTAPFNAGLVGPERRSRWLEKSFGEIREIRRALGGTINDVVLAVVSEGVSRYLVAKGEAVEDQHMRIMCPVNVRTESKKGALGNQVSAIFPVLPAWPMALVQRLAAVIAETDRIKGNSEAQALTMLQDAAPEPWPVGMWPTQLVGSAYDPTAVAARMPAPLLPAGIRPPNVGFNFVCTNVPGVQVPQYLCGHEVSHQIGVLLLSANLGFGVTILSYNKKLVFGFISEPRLLPDVERIQEHSEAAFEELLAAARERASALQA